MGIAYATREDVMTALAFNETARLNTVVDRACQSASRSLESLCHRVFYPTIDSRTFRRVNDRRPRHRSTVYVDRLSQRAGCFR
jgi:tRNA U54 and U55 pseudouridine synthase Pus10